MSDAKYEEVTNYFKERMAESKKINATRGREARLAAQAARLAKSGPTWRQLSGMQLMAHEMGHNMHSYLTYISKYSFMVMKYNYFNLKSHFLEILRQREFYGH